MLVIDEPGVFTVVVTNTNGCTSEATLVVDQNIEEVDFDVMSTIIDCNNLMSVITLDAAGPYEEAIILDQASDMVTSIDPSTQLAQLSEAGSYSLEVIGINGCPSVRNFEVGIDTSTIDFNLEAGLLNCNNEPVEISLLNLSEPFAMASYTSETMTVHKEITGDFLVQKLGPYDVTLVGANGCENTETVSVLQNQDIPDFTLFSNRTLSCEGEGSLDDLSITGGNAPYQVLIDNQEETFSASIAVSGLGQHSLQIIDAKGCVLDTNFILEPLPDLEAFHEPEIMILEGTELQLSLEIDRNLEDVMIEWQPQIGLSCFDCLDPFFVGTEDTEYTVTVVDQFGCFAETRVNISIEEIIRVYIPNVLDFSSSQNENGAFTIFSGDDDIEAIESLSIYDRWGNLIFEGFELPHNDPNSGWDGRRAGEEVEQGVYVYYARVRYSNQEVEDFVGDVTLIK